MPASTMNKIPVTELAELCREESEWYRRGRPDDRGHCYELFRRAIVDRDQEAWTAAYEQYRRLVGKWVNGSADQIDERTNQVFAKFWQAVDPQNFTSRFTGIGKVMAFLQKCAYSVCIDKRRREKKHQLLTSLRGATVGTGDTTSEQTIDNIMLQELFERVEQQLHDEQERLVFHLSFKVGLKPTQIAQEHPDVFTDAKEVRRIKERVNLRLKSDLRLQEWWRG